MIKKSKKENNLILYILLIIGGLAMFVPFYWMVLTSLKDGADVLLMPPKWIPDPMIFDSYVTAWSTVNFARFTMNSIFIVTMDLIGVVLSCAMIAFGLAMFEFRFKKLIFLAIVATLMLPDQVTLIPTYFIWKNLNAFDTYYPLIVPSFLGKAFGIFLLHQFFKSLPKELFEAAIIDGYKPWGVLWRIYFPLAKPAISALAVFTFISAWSNTLGPLLYLTSKDMFTLSLGLLFLKSDNLLPTDTPILMAGSVIITIPVVIVFLFAQRQFIQGMANTGLKG